jgi:hypothetical protein
MIKSGAGITSDINTFVAKVDNIVPTLQLINKGSYELDNTSNIIQKANYGISGAVYKCTNKNGNTEVTTINSINKLGLNNISCYPDMIGGTKLMNPCGITLPCSAA